MGTIFPIIQVAPAALALLAASACQMSAQTWTLTSAPLTNWTSVACSADGSNILAAVGGGSLYSSKDLIAWTPTTAPVAPWQSVAVSADARKAVAVTYPGLIYTSCDSGLTWYQSPAPTDYWSSVASSGDGNRLVAGTYGTGGPPAISGKLCTSTNSGASWQVVSNLPGPFNSVAASADGTTFAAVGCYAGPGVFGASDGVSTNWGEGIMHIYPQAIEPWTAVACSASGVQMVAGAYGDSMCVSPDAGTTWTRLAGSRLFCSSVAMSADGKRMVAAERPNLAWPGLVGSIYTSTDFGSTWVSNAVPITNWSCVASSADGCKLVAVVNGGGIYTWQTTPAPVLDIIPSGKNLLLSWIVPSMNFVLQENPHLTTTGWSDLGTSSALNYSNLQFQVTLPAPAGTRFYRLTLR